MAIEAYDNTLISRLPTTTAPIGRIAYRCVKFVIRAAMSFLYTFLFIFTLTMIGFIEIRQANMAAFNSLIATLEQRDAYLAMDLSTLLHPVEEARIHNQDLLKSFGCASMPATHVSHIGASSGSAQSDTTKPSLTTLCDRVQDNIYALGVMQDDLVTKHGVLQEYYVQYRDGITQQAPQIIPALRFLDSAPRWITAIARAPFEIMELLLLVCMGMLGGVINLTRRLIEKAGDDPTVSDLIYKPAIGGAVALGIYVLFRATQLFIAGQTQPGGVAATSIFLVAGLGLASGVCASDAIGRMEVLARRLLHGPANAASVADDTTGPRDARHETADERRNTTEPTEPGLPQKSMGSHSPGGGPSEC